MSDLKGQVALVTGSNTGIGLATATGLAARGALVILGCRDLFKAEAARVAILQQHPGSQVEVLAIDLASLMNISSAVEVLKRRHKKLHILINNAGIMPTKRQETRDGMERTFGVNHVGTFALTKALLPLLKASAPARIVTVSSALHRRAKMNWDDLEFRQRPYKSIEAYNQSKLANVLMTRSLARLLEGSGVTAHALHPGVVATELARDYPDWLMSLAGWFMLSPEKGARCSLFVATDPSVPKHNGAYFEGSKVKKPNPAALLEQDQDKLWKLSEQLTAGMP